MPGFITGKTSSIDKEAEVIRFWLGLGAALIMLVSALIVYLITNRWDNGRYSLKSNRNIFFLFVIIAWGSLLYLMEYLIVPQ